jgi:hypothetical protein
MTAAYRKAVELGLTDFTTTAFAAGDIVRCELTAIASATWIKVQLEGTKN